MLKGFIMLNTFFFVILSPLSYAVDICIFFARGNTARQVK